MSLNLDHLANLERVAMALEKVGVHQAFVGGATHELFLDTPAATGWRPWIASPVAELRAFATRVFPTAGACGRGAPCQISS